MQAKEPHETYSLVNTYRFNFFKSMRSGYSFGGLDATLHPYCPSVGVDFFSAVSEPLGKDVRLFGPRSNEDTYYYLGEAQSPYNSKHRIAPNFFVEKIWPRVEGKLCLFIINVNGCLVSCGGHLSYDWHLSFTVIINWSLSRMSQSQFLTWRGRNAKREHGHASFSILLES